MSSSVRRLVLMFAVPILLIAAVSVYYVTHLNVVSTDNAYVQRDKVSISAEVGGRIVEVAVRENQHVDAGDLLFRLDRESFELAVAEAAAAVASAEAQLEVLQTTYDNSSIDIESALEAIAYYEREYRRQRDLAANKLTTEAELRAAEHPLEQARFRLASARADAAKAKAALSTGSDDSDVIPAVRAARVKLQQARLNLSRTEVRAPVSGIVSQIDRLQVGQLMVQGLPAVTIVRDDSSWIEANFKETDLNDMRVGQPVAVSIDAYPGMKLQGRVESIGAGTGSDFSILPAQNANGNWVKVTQRVPVRISIEGKSERALIAGLSAHVKVDTRNR